MVFNLVLSYQILMSSTILFTLSKNLNNAMVIAAFLQRGPDSDLVYVVEHVQRIVRAA